MQLLQAINIGLRAIGVEPIASPTTDDVVANLVVDTITRTRRQILETGFAFNRRKVTLALDTDNRVPVSPDYLDVELPKGLALRTAEGGGGGRFVWHYENDDWWHEAIDQVKIVHDITEFSNIPEPYARWIAADNAITFFSEHMGPEKPVPNRLYEERNVARQKAQNAQPEVTIDAGTGWGSRLARRTR